jgi:DNA-binding NarL/FixJ family response regulator
LRAGTVSMDRARGRLRKSDPERALGTWKGLVAARWTLVECFESDGRRYVLARENEPAPSFHAALSDRERQVLANAALGRSNKEIAYALGLADSTVRVLLSRAAKKLRASTREELVRRFEALSGEG